MRGGGKCDENKKISLLVSVPANQVEACASLLTFPFCFSFFSFLSFHSPSLLPTNLSLQSIHLSINQSIKMKVGDKCLKCGKGVMALSEGYGLDSGECFHKECFKCEKCRIIITDGSFAMEGTAVYHQKCRSLAMGDVCRTCQQPIYDAILTFKGTKFHSECFTCATCANPLSGKAFSDIDGKLLCGTCSTAYQLEKAKIQKETSAASASSPAAVKPTVISTTGSAPPVEITSSSSSSAHDEPDITCEKCKKKVSPTVRNSKSLLLEKIKIKIISDRDDR